ncbi:polysaccharide export outer membrane protein [Hydrogenispora ethanolica]|uniref:Polysaccharide export outer membrane protein n=1 Tax=Hydrogenispora ethanolica TaxID=1082276 RepID=A0A4R1RVT3_HYDET|nr:polysaccharide biosynthesis/export family protein [Hydrogenispora ethanolica]TCL70775.1 polysaccharide export outer membrane protein [Hydrogenispora ethanolica]
MKRLGWCWIFTMLIGLFVFCVSAWADDYRLGPGDVITISVYGYPELQVEELSIGADGRIIFPLAGGLVATGLTTQELANQLTSSLALYVKNPHVTVNVSKFRTTRVYVLGEVSKPGMYEIEKQHNLLDAIGMAGGYTKFAVRSKVYVVRKGSSQYQEVNLDSILKKGDMSQNIALNDGDVVFLTKSGMSFVYDILPLINSAYNIRNWND